MPLHKIFSQTVERLGPWKYMEQSSTLSCTVFLLWPGLFRTGMCSTCSSAFRTAALTQASLVLVVPAVLSSTPASKFLNTQLRNPQHSRPSTLHPKALDRCSIIFPALRFLIHRQAWGFDLGLRDRQGALWGGGGGGGAAVSL